MSLKLFVVTSLGEDTVVHDVVSLAIVDVVLADDVAHLNERFFISSFSLSNQLLTSFVANDHDVRGHDSFRRSNAGEAKLVASSHLNVHHGGLGHRNILSLFDLPRSTHEEVRAEAVVG